MLSSVWFWLWTLLLACLIAFSWRSIYEPRRLDVTKVLVDHPPSGAATVRLALLSDFHAEHFYLKLEDLITAIWQSEPHAIAFTGDLVSREVHAEKGHALLRRIRQHPRLQNLPFFAVLGNHDSPAIGQGLEALGIKVLQNSSSLVSLQGQTWQIIGLEDLRNGNPDFQAALGKTTPLPPSQRIVLCHNPDSIFGIPEGGAALVLSGHFHGGQIWTPFRLEFMMLRRERLPKAGMTRGLIRCRNLNLYISRGLGCVSLPLRFMSRPELAILELTGNNTHENVEEQDGGIA